MEWILDHLEVIPNPLFHTIKSLRWYIFKTHRNPMRKHYDSLEIVNQRGSFSQNILKSIFFWLGPFLALIFEFKITNHFLFELWIDLTEGTVKTQAWRAFLWGISFKPFFFFSFIFCSLSFLFVLFLAITCFDMLF